MATLQRWDPFKDLMDIHSGLNQLFSRAYAGDASDQIRGADWSPVLDVYESVDRFVVTIELPGLRPDQVDISVEDGRLTISGERKFYEAVNQDSFHRVERRFGGFSRTLSLPTTADPDRIEAAFENGLLTITVPKREEAKPRKITVKATA